MKTLIVILSFISTIALISCSKKGTDIEEPLNAHEVVVGDYISIQKDFVEVLRGIRDEKSFDSSKKDLEAIVTKFDELAKSLKSIETPDAELASSMARKVQSSNSSNVPTGLDMLNLMVIETRSEEIADWMKRFTESGKKVGVELNRIYPQIQTENK